MWSWNNHVFMSSSTILDNSIGLCSEKLVANYCCCDILHQHHSTLTKFFNFDQLVVLYPKLITKSKNILNWPSPLTIMNCLSWLLSPPLIVITMIIIILVENLDYNYLDLNSLRESKWKNIGIKTSSSDGQHNSGGFHHKNNWHVLF